MQLKRILLATDYSDVSRHALDVASSLARDAGALLLVVHVHEWAEHPTDEDGAPHPPPDELQKLHEAGPMDTDIRCEFHLLHFRPPGEAGVIVDFANREEVDMIVVGTHARKGISHLLAGSVAEAIMREAACPVVVVKQAN